MYSKIIRLISRISIAIAGVASAVLFLSSSVCALEKSDVTSTFSADYSVNEENEADVTISIIFHNNAENPTILTSYDLNLGNIKPESVKVYHNNSTLSYEVTEAKGYIVTILIGDVLLRSGADYEVKVSYVLKPFFHENGGAYDAGFPLFKLNSKSKLDKIGVSYPEVYGPVNYSNAIYEADLNDNRWDIDFEDSDELSDIYFSAGSKKFFSFTSERKLVNDQDVYVNKTVLLFPDLTSQSIVMSSISEYPGDVYKSDTDNYVLTYDVPPEDDLWVRFRGYIEVSLPTEEQRWLSLSPAEKTVALDTQQKWWKISDDKIIKDLGQAEEMEFEKKLEWIYGYVMESLNLSGDFRTQHDTEYRKGANVSLRTYKNATAEDFADAYVGLARYLNIPSRVVAGYVFPYAASGDMIGMFHVWPQYWDPDLGWISVDPAYEKYTDLNMEYQVGLNRVITMIVTDELDESLFSETSSEIFLTNEEIAKTAHLEAEIEIDDKISAGLSQTGVLKVKNDGNTILSGFSFTEEDAGFSVEVDENNLRDVILPGEEVEFKFNVKIDNWYWSGDKKLKFLVVAEGADNTLRTGIEKTFEVKPLWWAEPVTWIVTLLVFAVITFLMFLFSKMAVLLFRRVQPSIAKLWQRIKKK
ncbi:hypothetical protein JW710_00745 [Candidatus Dojkabacteria bacterium]|nr:hypothetical protein [Candidatus Dojkabacteria bacterium]